MNYQCLIVDDERPALKLLTAYIDKLPQLQLAAACENAFEAINTLQQYPIDLLFLDIQMPNFTGLELLQTLQSPPQVILTTAYREFAVEGFALNVSDYLVKPFSFERFVQAVNKASAPIQSNAQNHLVANSDSKEYLFVRTNHKLEKIRFADICYIESMREYVSIHTSSRRYIANQTMKVMEEKLPKSLFMRIHRSYIVYMDGIDAIHGNEVQIGDKKIPVGRSYRTRFFARIEMI